MTPTERMFYELKKQGKTISRLCAYLGIGTNVIANWKKSNTIPPAKYLVNISEFLDISTDYLLTGQECSTYSISDNEQQLIKMYRQLSPETRGQVYGYLLKTYETAIFTKSTSYNPPAQVAAYGGDGVKTIRDNLSEEEVANLIKEFNKNKG
jgi:transcriptional regulator with XRE-family HTH domain|nr:MAG TPA: CI repressor [Caudoviricetes sp.]